METFILQTPIGALIITADDNALHGLDFADGDHECPSGYPKNMGYAEIYDQAQKTRNKVIKQAVEELAHYFTKGRKKFTVPLAVNDKGTDFQQKCWRALCDIPYGETRTYKDMAEAVGSPKAFRAVGGANHHNPIVIIMPCHRVVGANRKLVGFGGGLWRKEWLLNHESASGAA